MFKLGPAYYYLRTCVVVPPPVPPSPPSPVRSAPASPTVTRVLFVCVFVCGCVLVVCECV